MKPSDIPMKEFYSPGSAPSLTENFAMKILEKEIELEKRPQPSLVSELVELYSQAIEFYNYQNDPKCYDYQDRMHKMLLKPQKNVLFLWSVILSKTFDNFFYKFKR